MACRKAGSAAPRCVCLQRPYRASIDCRLCVGDLLLERARQGEIALVLGGLVGLVVVLLLWLPSRMVK